MVFFYVSWRPLGYCGEQAISLPILSGCVSREQASEEALGHRVGEYYRPTSVLLHHSDASGQTAYLTRPPLGKEKREKFLFLRDLLLPYVEISLEKKKAHTVYFTTGRPMFLVSR